MSLEQIWINKNKTGHNFIVFNNKILYKRKVKKEDFVKVENELKRGIVSDKFLGLPLSYIKLIEYRSDKKQLKISHSKESEDTIDLEDANLRKEIFDYLKNNTSPKDSFVKTPSILSRIKKPLIALVILSGVFIYILNVIQGMNDGYEYEIVGRRPGIGGIVLGLAGLGLTTNILIFTPLALIAIYQIFVKYKDDNEVHYLIYN